MPWTWEENTTRYRDQDTGRFLAAPDIRDLSSESIRIAGTGTDGLASMQAQGQINLPDWQTLMRQEMKDEYIQQYELARGGLQQMTPQDWGSIGGMLADQYRFLGPFAQEIADGNLTEAQIAQRSRMYINSAREAASRANMRARGWPELPAHPGDGSTVCLCITTPESRVLTSTGWRPIGIIEAGERVLTHRGRWRKVLHSVVKESQPEHRQVWIQGPTGEMIGCTDTHEWLTRQGWMNAIDIDSACETLYHVGREVLHGTETLSYLRGSPWKQKQARYVHEMRQVDVGMPMRKEERLPGEAMPVLQQQPQSQKAMGREPSQDYGWDSCREFEATHAVQRFERGHELADQGRRAQVDVVLGTRREQAHGLSLSVDLAHQERSDPARLCCASYRPRCIERQSGELALDGLQSPCATARRDLQGGSGAAHLPYVRRLLPQARAQGPSKQVLFGGLLPRGTTLYDIVVDEDHSYIVEGLVSHNTNCACHWTGERQDRLWDFVWHLDFEAEHCTSDEIDAQGRPRGCIERAALWDPLVIEV